MQTTSNWYALYTRPRWEKKVVTLLTRQGIETYCPFTRVTKQWSDRKKVVEEPLFKSYVFIRIPEADQWMANSVDGVINIVHWLGKAAVIPDEEIETIRRFLYDYSNVKLEKTEVNVNDTVRILNGPMMMMEGNVVEIKYKTVKVILPSLGYAMVAEVEKSNLEIINLIPDKSKKISKSDSMSLDGEIPSQQTGLREEDAIN